MNTALVAQAQAQADPWVRCLVAFLADVHDRSGSDKTPVSYASHLRRFFAMHPYRSPSDFTREDVLTFLHQPISRGARRGEQPSVATRNNRLVVVNRLFTFASTFTITSPESGKPTPVFMGINPCAGLHRGKPAKPRRVLNEDELARFFASMDVSTVIGARDFSFFWTVFATARRRSEIANLCWGDIQHTVLVDPDGTQRQGYQFCFRNKGSSGTVDTQELPLSCYQAIIRYLEMSSRLASMESDNPVWTGVDVEHGGSCWLLDPYKRWADNSITVRIKRYVIKAGLDPAVSTHWLRHSSARERYLGGAPLLEIQHVLRHQSLDTTYHYLRSLVSGSADKRSADLERKFLPR
jgi:integrase